MKKILFFDADGTLWYPKTTKREKHPGWIWNKYGGDINRVKEEIALGSGVFSILKKLKKRGIKLIVFSNSPFPEKEANLRVKIIVEYLGLLNILDGAYGVGNYLNSKGDFVVGKLKEANISKKDALMVGDDYSKDYKSAKRVGVDCLLIEHPYNKSDTKRIKRKVKNFSDILTYL